MSGQCLANSLFGIKIYVAVSQLTPYHVADC